MGNYTCTYILWNLSILDTSGPERTVLISGVRDVLSPIIGDCLVPVTCVHIRGLSAIQGSRLEGCLQSRGLE